VTHLTQKPDLTFEDAKMSTPQSSPDELDPKELQTPLLVGLAAGALASAAGGMLIIAIQMGLNINSAYHVESWVYGLLVAYVVTGLGGAGCAALLAKGKPAGAIGGIIFALLFLSLFWTPTLIGFFAVSSILCAGFAFLSIPLVGISIPMTLRLAKTRKAFMDSI
jgi:hypothetical protein